MKYKCLKCGEYHHDWPAFGYTEPYYYSILSDEDKNNLAEINDDFCIIKHEEQTDYFIRVILKLKVINSCEDLEYGVWVSLSEKNFSDYKNNYQSENHIASYFGYLCNDIIGYESTLSLSADVETKTGNDRPEIFLHDDQMNNSLVKDCYDGITIKEAEKRLKLLLKI